MSNTLSATGLENDPNGDELTASLVSNVTGQAEFTYEVSDGNGGVDSTTGTIDVEHPG